MNKKIRKIVDLSLFLAFILLPITSARWIAVHQITGILMLLLIIIHLYLNIGWIKNSLKNLFKGKMNKKAKRLLVLAALLAIAFTATIITGILAAQALSIDGGGNHPVHRLHTLSAIISGILVLLHIKLNWSLIKLLLRKKDGPR